MTRAAGAGSLLGVLLCLVIACGETPREESAGGAAPAVETGALPGVGAAPASQAVARTEDAPPGEVPWLPNGELIEVQQLADATDPDADITRTVFEIAATPEEAVATYRAALERSGWDVQMLGEKAIIGYTGSGMVTAVFKSGGGVTRVEVYVNVNPG